MNMIDLLRMFLKAKLIGDWDLHLRSLHDMLPYFAASGHRLYLKSVHLYLQKMAHLLYLINTLKSSNTSKKASMSSVDLIAVGLNCPQIWSLSSAS